MVTKRGLGDYKPDARWSQVMGKATAPREWTPAVRLALVLPPPRDFKKTLSAVFPSGKEAFEPEET